MSTGMGEGIALPHCASAELPRPVLAVARKPEGLDFEALDGKPVRLLFLLAGPKDQPAAQLRLLSRLARLLRDPAFLEALLAADSPPRCWSFSAGPSRRSDRTAYGPAASQARQRSSGHANTPFPSGNWSRTGATILASVIFRSSSAFQNPL